ncbi:MAG: hypothetical protein AMJ65_10930 [Phycisphaerae bacterium SG8_4]|nr:MAG: hypothetical protein AMJ65_10930 [Phycisphaerae bacterium SG8_4]
MIYLQIFALVDHLTWPIGNLNSVPNNTERTAHIVLGIIHWNFQHHCLVFLLEVRNMRTVPGRASPTLFAAGQGCCKKGSQYYKRHVLLHVLFLLFRSAPAIIAWSRNDHRVCAKEYRTFIVQSNRVSSPHLPKTCSQAQKDPRAPRQADE